ncbi:tyrosyl-tRNA synthetase, putative [Theileria annulata]|uniref:tyrosine--tRNA ligase n=1 Tax=Theileria annulata TaxID=5874 RepID=Q4UHU8_THEAN|nr:tyrosyl-tRNA synthetase, putative [Theileria annulata]CAI73341.1 tyrosyl-tRNA synthetase, putative [Theileria annulata]|eukprot:XP_954018.1 tyrosyl-tRNA synthetase, putative [Theileria annulata]
MERSMISQSTDFVKLDQLLTSYQTQNFNNSMYNSIYYGIDCTNDFIHEGTLFQLLLLRRFLSEKFNVVLVIGGGTTLVGDPSYKLRRNRNDKFYFSNFVLNKDKSEFDTTNEQSIEQIATKILSLPIKIDNTSPDNNNNYALPKVVRVSDLSTDLDVSSEMCNPYRVFIVNNRDIYNRVNLMEYLETVARNMNVGRMLSRDCIKIRTVDKDGTGYKKSINMDLSELMYMSLQAMDFVYLAENFNCKIQLGGNDQLGNIISGIELASSLGIGNIFGITTPLLKDKFGEKISKTGSNCFLKITNKISPHEFWSHFRSVDDSVLEKYYHYLYSYIYIWPINNILYSYLKWFTDVSLDKIKETMAEHYNSGKVLLADELTRLLYGNQMVELIHKFCMSKQFSELKPFLTNFDTNMEEFESFINFSKAVPHINLTSQQLSKVGVKLLEVLDAVRVPQFSNACFHSNKKFIKEGGCRVNGNVVTDVNYTLTEDDVVKLTSEGNHYKYISIQMGNRRLYFLIVDYSL